MRKFAESHPPSATEPSSDSVLLRVEARDINQQGEDCESEESRYKHTVPPFRATSNRSHAGLCDMNVASGGTPAESALHRRTLRDMFRKLIGNCTLIENLIPELTNAFVPHFTSSSCNIVENF